MHTKLSERQLHVLCIVDRAENVPIGRLNHSASILSDRGLLQFHKYNGRNDGVTYSLTNDGRKALTLGVYTRSTGK